MSFKIIYNEKDYAEKVLTGEKPYKSKRTPYGSKSFYGLILLVKLLRMQYIEEMGLTYAEWFNSRRKKKEVNDQIWRDIYNMDLADVEDEDITRIVSKTSRFKLQTAENPVPITKSEKAVLETIEDDKDRRMMFIYLVDSKFYRFNSVAVEPRAIDEGTIFLVNDDNLSRRNALGVTIGLKPIADKEFINMFRYRMWDDSRNYLERYEQSVIRHEQYVPYDENGKPIYPERLVSKLNFVDIDDSPENVAEWITDWENLDLHYERLFGTTKKGMKLVKCEDCGKLFYVPTSNKRQVRCEECQEKHRKEAKRIAAQNRRSREKVDSIN